MNKWQRVGWISWAALVAFVLFVGFAPGWSACAVQSGGGNFKCIDGTGYNPGVCTSDSRCAYADGAPIPQVYDNCGAGKVYVYSVAQGSVYYSYNACWFGRGTLCCDSQAEADSAYCVQYPTAERCIVETDTTLFACSDLGNGKSGIFRLACRAQNGVVVSCNGKTDVNVETDGTLVREQSGTCAQNGFDSGIIGGASSDSTPPEPKTAECFAVVGSKCFMRDRNSGNTYSCECDGSCEHAMREQASGRACANPYPQPTSSDINLSSWNEASSSASSPASSTSDPASSGGEPGSSSSGDTPPMSDFEYDYTDVLEDIRANTQYTGNQLNSLNSKAETANSLLQRIANKDMSPVVNVDARDTINVTLNADTAKSGAAILALLDSKMNGGEPNESDTAGTGAQLAGVLSNIDSLLNEGTPDMTDSIGRAVSGYRGAYDALKDSMAASAWNDSVSDWQRTLLDNGVISGSGSDNCPQVLQRTFNVSLGIGGTITFGPLGKFLCAAVPGAGVTFWALARVVLRALVSITCMIWLFKAVMGIDGGSNDED